MKTINFLAVVALALIGCGDNKDQPDARVRPDVAADAFMPPAVPTLGAQIDRMGRPVVNTALNHGFDPTTAAQTAKVAYNEQTAKTDWLAQAQVGEFMKNLALIDVLDSGKCGNGICETGETGTNCPKPTAATDPPGDCDPAQTGAGNGCGNQVLYNGGQGGPAMALSYASLAAILAEDELYLDTGKTTCSFYLGVEFGVVTGGGNSTCGGRAPEYDVIDFSLSMIAMGLKGFSTDGMFTPQIKDGVDVHADVSAANFPFLGTPH
ncbi:MAG TPA: DUF4331 family protein [Kofleriaceae bacterium]|nr:DUF4331 family protein [Kofleriaceae bacterium]